MESALDTIVPAPDTLILGTLGIFAWKVPIGVKLSSEASLLELDAFADSAVLCGAADTGNRVLAAKACTAVTFPVRVSADKLVPMPCPLGNPLMS
jgi:hypothetical protein